MVGLCRLCASLKKTDLLINIIDETNDICQKMETCFQFKITIMDAMPKSVCQSCLELLNVFYSFYAKVQEAQETLKALFPSEQECPEEDNLSVAEEPAQTPEQTTSSDNVEAVENIRRQTKKKTAIKLKLEGEHGTQETLKALYANKHTDKPKDNVPVTMDDSAIKDSATANSTKEKEQIVEHVKRHKKSVCKIRADKEGVQQSKQESSDTRNLVFTIANAVSETEVVSGHGDNDDNDGYLQEVYSILGMSHAGHPEPTPEEQESMDCLETRFAKEEQCPLITQEEHLYLDDEEQHLLDDEFLMMEEKHIKDLPEDDDNVELEEIVLDENATNQVVEMYYDFDEYSSQNANEDDTHTSLKVNDDTDYSNEDFSERQLTSWKSYKHSCHACTYKTYSLKDLIKHVKALHSMGTKHKMTYKCNDCQEVIEYYCDYLNHVRLKHHPALKLRCDACDMQCNDYKQLELHRNCNCWEKKKHPTIFTCSFCCITFRSTAAQLQHMRQHVECTSSLNYKCKQCPKEFRKKSSLSIHEIVHKTPLNPKGGPYRCHICQKDFTSHTYLERHKLIHSNEKPFSCTFCPRQFRTKIEQTTHERVHTGEMPLQCIHCEKRFRFRSALSAHLKTHTNIRPYTCTYCSRPFNDKSNYKKHVRRKHPNEL